MNNNTIDPSMQSLHDEPMPKHLHAKIMRRVFIAGYGKYLFGATAVMFVNLGVLGTELYRRLVDLDVVSVFRKIADAWSWDPSYMTLASKTLYAVLPLQAILATSITAVLTGYMAYLFLRLYRNPREIGLFRTLIS